MTSKSLQRCALGAAFALSGIAIVEIALRMGGQPLSPLGWPGLGIVAGALLGGLPAALAGAVVALGYAVQQFATPERFPLFFSSAATILAWIIGLGLAGALCVWMRAGLDRLQTAELSLRESEARFRALFELSPDAIVVHSGSVVLYVNAAALKLFGAASQEAIVGMEANDLAFPESLPERQERLDYLLANPGASIPFADRKYRRLDGTPVDVEVAAYSYAELGAIRVVLVARDITARKHAEDALRDSEARYRALFELSPDPIVVTNGRIILFANSATITLAHASSTSDIVGKEAMHFVHPDSAPMVRERLGKLLSAPGASVPFMDMKYLDIDGGTLEVEAGAASFSEAGEIRVLISMRDITERKHAEQALASAKERLQRALEGSSLALWETDLRSGKVYLSEGWAELLGEAVGDTYTTVNELADLVPSAELSELERLSKETMKGLRSFYSVEHRVRTSDGDWKWIRSTGKVSERDESGRALRMTGTNRDITEQKQAELELKSAREHVEQMNVELEDRVRLRTSELATLVKELETLNYAVAHDLHTSLGVMSVNAGLLLHDLGGKLAEDHRRALGEIAENANLTAKRLDDLLAYSQLALEPFERRTVATRGLVTDVWRDLVRIEPGRQLSFAAGELPDCVGDRKMIAQLWIVLLSNAIIFTKSREQARVEAGYDTGRKAYFVRDNGVGFDMRYADKLFGVFERLHHDECFEGTGMGLAIAARIVRRHGGRIWAEARPGEGATFCFSLSGE